MSNSVSFRSCRNAVPGLNSGKNLMEYSQTGPPLYERPKIDLRGIQSTLMTSDTVPRDGQPSSILKCVAAFENPSTRSTRFAFCCTFFTLFLSEIGKPWKTHLKDLPNAAAFAAQAARQKHTFAPLRTQNFNMQPAAGLHDLEEQRLLRE